MFIYFWSTKSNHNCTNHNLFKDPFLLNNMIVTFQIFQRSLQCCILRKFRFSNKDIKFHLYLQKLLWYFNRTPSPQCMVCSLAIKLIRLLLAARLTLCLFYIYLQKKKKYFRSRFGGVHMGPGNYGLFPVHFLPIFWPYCSLFIKKKCVQFIIYMILPLFFIRFSPQFSHLLWLRTIQWPKCRLQLMM